MRKRRVILFNFERETGVALSGFFGERGYEIVIFRDRVICPVSRKGEKCPGSPNCCDIAVIRHDMPFLNGVGLIAAQQACGCGLDTTNKAIIGSSTDEKDHSVLAAWGVPLFMQPLDFGAFAAWVAEREARMNLARPVAIRRREERIEAGDESLSLLLRGEESERVALVNKSMCGVCFRTSRRLLPNQMLAIHTDLTGTIEDATVRWVRPDNGGAYLVGLSYCI